MRNAHETRLTLDEMNQLLQALDDKLDELHYTGVVNIRALGGYAMLYHGLRKNMPTTPDIDTSTPAFDSTTQKAIQAVATKNNLTSHWLNNDTVLDFTDTGANWDDVTTNDAIIDAHFQPSNQKFKHITLEVADIDTLMHAKAIAASDVYSDRGDKDLDDCLSILDHEHINSYRKACQKFPFLTDSECSNFKGLYDIATTTSNQMRAAMLQAHRDMIKDSGLEIPDFGAEIDDFAYGYEDDFSYSDYEFDDDWF